MKAALLIETGTGENFSRYLTIDEIPIPEVKDDEVLINIKYSSLNHRDLFIVKGAYPKIKLPVVVGSDCAGVVHEIGKKATEFSIGDEVIVNPGFNWGNNEDFQSKDFKILGMPDNGTLSEYISVHKSNVYRKPAHLTLQESAAIPLAGITAYRTLFKKAELNEKDFVLIPGIGSGVSIFALLYALNAGSAVFVTSGSDEKISKALTLGASGGANYNNVNWDKEIIELSGNRISTIIDGAGGDTFRKCIELVNYGGRIVCYGATLGNVTDFPMARLFWKQLKICLLYTSPSPRDRG
jgi:NADPH:quinone reductase-like Zn-dependent oxidoreductase